MRNALRIEPADQPLHLRHHFGADAVAGKRSSLWVAMTKSSDFVIPDAERSEAIRNPESDVKRGSRFGRALRAHPGMTETPIARAVLRDWQDTIAAPIALPREAATMRAAGDFSESPRPTDRPCAPRVADPDPVACAHRRPRHRPLRLLAGAAGHARQPRLVLFVGRLHEYDQCGRLSRRRVDRGLSRSASDWSASDTLANGGRSSLAGALRADGQFHRSQLRPIGRRTWPRRSDSSPAERWQQRSRNRSRRDRTSCSACSMSVPASAFSRPD